MAMIKDAKNAEKFKFTNMSKKLDFLPTTRMLNPFEKLNSLCIGDSYMDGFNKAKLCQPDKALEDNKWGFQKTCEGDLFMRTVR